MSDKTENDSILDDESIPTSDSNIEQDLTTEESTDTNTEQAEESLIKLKDELSKTQAEASKQRELAVRTMADMENLRRRTRIDIEGAHKFALEKFVNDLIPVIDSMELGLDAASKEDTTTDSLKEGLDITFKQFLDVMQKYNVERINPTGEKFDSKLHEAMTMIPSPEHESQAIIEVFQKGYTLNERLVRAARVVIAQ